MPRRSRIVLPNVAHHVTQRGSRRGMVFFSGEDKALYLQLIRHYAAESGTSVIGYCLMDNHVHHILVPSSTDSLSRMLGAAHMRYASMINARSGWTGHLWQERFFSCPLDEEYFWTALRYVERNPVVAGLVSHAADYQWSSAAAHCGLAPDYNLSVPPDWNSIISTRKNWSEWLSEGDEQSRVQLLRQRTKRALPCGNAEFIAKIEGATGVKLFTPRGRPPSLVGNK